MRAQVASDLWRSLVDGSTTGTDLQPSTGVPIGWLGQGTGEAAVLMVSASHCVVCWQHRIFKHLNWCR